MKRIKINNCLFELYLQNSEIEKYILNRFRGFVVDKYVEGTNLCILTEEKGEVCSGNTDPDNITVQKNETITNYFIGNYAVIRYSENEKKIVLTVNEMPPRIMQLIAVKLCDIILDFLFQNHIYCMHCGVIVLGDDCNHGIAIIGHSGSGKTSLTIKLTEKGARLTNDDLAYFTVTDGKMRVVKNTQYIGLDEYNLKNNFSYLMPYVARESFLDKSRIDLYSYNPLLYVDDVVIDTFCFISDKRKSCPDIHVFNVMEACKKILEISNQFNRGRCTPAYINSVLDICSSSHLYEVVLTPSVSESSTYLHKVLYNI